MKVNSPIRYRATALFVKLLFISSSFLHSSSCSKEHELKNLKEAVLFSGAASIGTSQVDPASSWSLEGKIGVYMLYTNSSEVVDLAENIPYTSNTQGVFTPVDKAIYYTQSGAAVDFVGYYPYVESLPDKIYKVDLKEQAETSKIDLWISNNAVNKKKSSESIAMLFTHRLSKLSINVKEGVEVAPQDLLGLEVAIQGVPNYAELNLANNTFSKYGPSTSIPLKMLASGNKYSAIILPQNKLVGSNVSFFVKSIGKFEWDISNIDFKPGAHYIYDITINRTGIEIQAHSIAIWEGVNKPPL